MPYGKLSMRGCSGAIMEHLWLPGASVGRLACCPSSQNLFFPQIINFISSRKMSAGGDSGEGSTPARGPRPYEWHLMQALMPRHFGPFDPAMFSRNAEQILENATADQKARAKLSADLEAEAFRRSLEQARIEVGPIGGPNIKNILGSPYVHDMTHMLANANTQKNTQAAKRGSAAPPASPTETPS